MSFGAYELRRLELHFGNFRMHMRLLSKSPPVLLTTTTNLVRIPGTDEIDTLSAFSSLLSNDQKGYFLIQPTWHFRDIVVSSNEVEILHRARERSGLGHVIILINESEDAALAHSLGLEWWNVHQNAFADERIFYPDRNVKKKYDAIYNARFDSFKNHYLAREISNLALLFGKAHSAENALNVSNELRHAHFINGSATDLGPNAYKRLTPIEIAAEIRQARTGLCLSFVEGAMYASIEYLLCGVPVVSVQNKGGRDEFAHSDYWLTCGRSSNEVAEAVKYFANRNVDPELISRQTYARISEHRSRLVELMRRLQLQSGNEPNWKTDWSFIRGSFGGMLHVSFDDIATELASS